GRVRADVTSATRETEWLMRFGAGNWHVFMITHTLCTADATVRRTRAPRRDRVGNNWCTSYVVGVGDGEVFVARMRSPDTRRRPTVSSRGPSDLAHTVRGSAIMVTPQTNSTGAVPVLGLPSNTPSLTGWRPMVPQPAPHYRHGI